MRPARAALTLALGAAWWLGSSGAAPPPAAPLGARSLPPLARPPSRLPQGVGLQAPRDLPLNSSPSVLRRGHTLTLLPDGRVLIAGGYDASKNTPGAALAFAEIYDPIARTYSFAGTMNSRRRGHAAVLRSDGRVVLLGGSAEGSDVSPAPEVFDPRAPLQAAFVPLASETLPSVVAPVVALSHGEAMVFSRPAGAPASKLATHAFRVDLFTGAVTEAGALVQPRRCFAAELLADGRVLVAQGESDSGALASTELSAQGAWSKHADAPQARSGCAPGIERPLRSLRMPSGDVLFGSLVPSSGALFYRVSTQSFAPDAVFYGVSGLALLPSGRLLCVPTDSQPFASPPFLLSPGPEEGFFLWSGSLPFLLDQPTEPPELLLLPSGDALMTARDGNYILTQGADNASQLATLSIASLQDTSVTFFPRRTELAVRYDGARDVAQPLFPAPIPRNFPRTLELPSGGFARVSQDQSPYRAFDLFSAAGFYTGSRCSGDLGAVRLLPLADGDLLAVSNVRAERYSPATDGCSKVQLNEDLLGSPLAALADGSALVVGGTSKLIERRASILKPGAGFFTQLPQLTALPHNGGQLLQPLADGRVLVAGGQVGQNVYPDAELLDPLTGASTPLQSKMATPRSGAQALLLPDGRALIAGGETSKTGAFPAWKPVILELFDPQSEQFSAPVIVEGTVGLHTMRWVPELQRVLLLAFLPDGNLGDTPEATHLAARYYDPATGAVTRPEPAAGAIAPGSALSRLPDGRMLVSGASIFTVDPRSLAFKPKAAGAPRSFHTATLLASGRVLLAGGLGPDGKALGSLDEFDPLTGSLTAVGQLQQPRARHTATLLPDGRLLFAGGTDGAAALASMEILAPEQASTKPLEVQLQRARAGHGAALLIDGRVLLAGGVGTPDGSLEFVDPVAKTTTAGPKALLDGPTRAAALPDGGALVGSKTVLRLDPQGFLTDVSQGGIEISPGTVPSLTGGSEALFSLPDGGHMACGNSECARFYPGLQLHRPLSNTSPMGLAEGLGERTPSGGLLLISPPLAGDKGPQLRAFHPVAEGVLRPSLVAPSSPLTAGEPATLAGARLLRRAVAGGEAATHPSAFPSVVWMPEAGGGPIFADIAHASDDSVTFALPGTVFRGPGFLHAVVTGVPSEGVFAVVQGLPPGAACSQDAACQGGICAEGVCCDSRCDSVCRSCLASKKGQGTDGRCEAFAKDAADTRCGKADKGACGATGLCTDAGLCATNDKDPCAGGGSCLAGTCLAPLPSTCEGDAVRVPDGPLLPCVPFRCADGQCLGSCTDGDDGTCAKGFFCRSGRCRRCTPERDSIDTGSETLPCEPARCVEGQCLQGCQGADDCQSGWECVGGQCAPACFDEQTERRGQAASPCKAGFRCVLGGCASECSSNRECLGGFECDRGQCVAQASEAPAPAPGACALRPGPAGGAAPWVLCAAVSLLAARRRRGWLRGARAASLLALASCRNDTSGDAPPPPLPSHGGSAGQAASKGTCVPGKQEACACLGGVQGVQVCKPDGSGFDPCLGCGGQGGAGAGGAQGGGAQGGQGNEAGAGAGQGGAELSGNSGQGGAEAGSAGEGGEAGSAGEGGEGGASGAGGDGGPCGGVLPQGQSCAFCARKLCCEQGQACAHDDNCRALSQCIPSCGDAACASGCASAHPGGLALYQQLTDCLQGECFCPGPQGGGAAGAAGAGGAGAGGACAQVAFSLLRPDCNECLRTFCCSQAEACAKEAPCTDFIGCTQLCKDDACRQECATFNPSGATIYIDQNNCTEFWCSSQCDRKPTCGLAVLGQNCQDCTDAGCCAQSAICAADPGCEKLYACASDCPTDACKQACAEKFAGATAAYEELRQCQKPCPCD